MMRQRMPDSIQPFHQLVNSQTEASLEGRSANAMVCIWCQPVAIPAQRNAGVVGGLLSEGVGTGMAGFDS